MKKTLFLLLISLSVLSCSKDSTNLNCDFIGKWCQVLFGTDCSIGIEYEFRANGELYQLNALTGSWESGDCETIEVFATATNQKLHEFKIISVTSDKLTMDVGVGPIEYTRVP